MGRDFRYSFRLPAAIFMVMLVVGCSIPDRVTKTHEGPRPADAPFHSFLVVDLSMSAQQRQEAEDLLTLLLNVPPRSVAPSHHLMGLDSPIEGAQIAEAAREVSAQVVLVTRVESVRVDVEKREDRADIKVSCRRGAPYDLFLYDYKELPIPDEIILKEDVVLSANLYRADDGTHLWGIQSQCFDQASVDDAISRHANHVVSELMRAGLIR